MKRLSGIILLLFCISIHILANDFNIESLNRGNASIVFIQDLIAGGTNDIIKNIQSKNSLIIVAKGESETLMLQVMGVAVLGPLAETASANNVRIEFLESDQKDLLTEQFPCVKNLKNTLWDALLIQKS
ncbi:MAG: hypothetical protein ACRCVN_05785 [Spirochaetia bacterium]